MPDLLADDLFEIYGTHIQISSIKDYRLGQIEFIKRPAYREFSRSRLSGLFRANPVRCIEFMRMEYYGAIIGETKYKNAVEEAPTRTVFEGAFKMIVGGVNDAIAGFQKNKVAKSIHYRIMNAAGRVFERTLEEIPAILHREDGKESEIFKNDELYPMLGEPIAPSIEMVPALFITSSDGNYVFFGNGIQVYNAEREYERLNGAVRAIKALRAQQASGGGLLQKILGLKAPQPTEASIPSAMSSEKQKALAGGEDERDTDS